MTEQGLSDSLALLCGQGLGQLLASWLLESLQMRLSSSVVPEFWSGLKQPENELEERDRAWVLLTAFRTLWDRLEPFLGKWKNKVTGSVWCSFSPFKSGQQQYSNSPSSFLLGGLERLGMWQDQGRGGLCGPGPRGLLERAFTIIRALLLFSPSPVLQERVLEFYSRTFSVYMNQEGEAEDGAEVPEGLEGGVCPGCGVLMQRCWCQEALERLQELSHIL